MTKIKAINAADAKTVPDRKQAEDAVRTLIRWAGDNPDRAGMAQTPGRVLDFYTEFFKGYTAGADDYAANIAKDVQYNDFILVQDIEIASFCEHHMLPATGKAHIAYIPDQAIAGIGTIARLAAECAARFSTQENITNDIADLMDTAFAPRGIAVMTELAHGCMGLRGHKNTSSSVVMTKFSGVFADKADIQRQFFMLTKDAVQAQR